MVPVDPGGTVGAVQAIGAEFGQVHVTPPAFTTATDTKVVFAGVASLSLPEAHALGPLFVMTCV